MALTLFDRIWQAHVAGSTAEGDLLHVDRHYLHDLGGEPALRELRGRGLPVARPDLTLAIADHTIATTPDRKLLRNEITLRLVDGLREGCAAAGIPYLEIGERGHGIVHVAAPELGLTLPGMLVVCCDSHTCTHGGLGAVGFGIGSSEVVHVLGSQVIVQRKPRQMRITLRGRLRPAVTAKDVALYVVGTIGAQGGAGFAVEYAGEAVQAMSIEERMTLCNLSIEFGAKIGLVAPDDKTLAYVAATPNRPRGEQWAAALEEWKTLETSPDARFDREVEIDLSALGPQMTWGIGPDQVIGVSEDIPLPSSFPQAKADAAERALRYMGLEAPGKLAGRQVDRVFIGSCTNGRIEDLRLAADFLRGRQVAAHVSAWVVPGSEAVKRQAESEGLDQIFMAAGFDWRQPGCSMCLAANGELARPRERVVSTTNRNFIGRQGKEVRTHLASPLTAAACAVAGAIVSPE